MIACESKFHPPSIMNRITAPLNWFVHIWIELITVGALITSEVIETLNISLLIASDEELAQGKFLAYESFDWRCGYASVGVNGNFARYHLGDDLDKIFELSEMLKAAFDRVGKKRKAKFNVDYAKAIVAQVTNAFLGNA